MTKFFIGWALGIVFVWATIVVFCGLAVDIWRRFHKKAAADPRRSAKRPGELKFTCIICAHNEERVISRPIEAILAAEYPHDKIRIVVFADNCADRTAEIARGFESVEVLEKRTPSHGKGDVLAWGLDEIGHAAGCDVVAVFDADNAPDAHWFAEMNQAFLKGAHVATGHRMAINPFVNVISGWYTIYWNLMNELSNRVRANLRMSSMLTGTGFAFKSAALPAEGWRTKTFVEDLEFAFFRNVDGYRVVYVPDAIFYDEQPVTVRPMLRQLNRWATGGIQILKEYFTLWFSTLWNHPSLRLFDCFIVILLGISGTAVLFYNIAILNWGFGVWFLTVTWLSALLGTALSRYSLRSLAMPILTFPFFAIILSLTVAYSIVHPQRSWKPIPHGA